MTLLPEGHNEIDSAAAIAIDSVAVEEVQPGRIYIDKANNLLIDTDKYLTVPRDYRQSCAELDTVESFLAYMDAHPMKSGPEIWVHMNPERTRIDVLGIVDANLEGHSKNTAVLRFDETRRWKEWQGINGQWLDQARFAEFLEDHTEDLLDPDAATMLEVAQSLRASIKTDFSQALRLDNGQTQLTYKEEIEGKAGKAGKLTIPNNISISVQPYTTSEVFKIDAKFRYRLNGGALSLGIKLMNADRVIEHLFKQILDKVTAAGIAPVYNGKP